MIDGVEQHSGKSETGVHTTKADTQRGTHLGSVRIEFTGVLFTYSRSDTLTLL